VLHWIDNIDRLWLAQTESGELMGNLTLAIEGDLLRRARVRAADQGTSVNAVVRELLGGYAAIDRMTSARRRLVALSVSSSSGSGETPLEADHGR